MVDVATKPIGVEGPFSLLHMGDPTHAAGQRPSLKTLLFPFPQTGTPTYASWKPGDTQWSSSPTIGPNELFQVSSTGSAIQGERSGPIAWLIIPGLD